MADDENLPPWLQEVADAEVERLSDWAMRHWGLVIDQVIGLAAVYGICHNAITTPDDVHDLWQEIIVAVDGAGRAQAAETTREVMSGDAVAATHWRDLTDALVTDLRLGQADDADADTWRKRVRDALWLAYGIGRRHEREGFHFLGQGPASPTPFDARSTP